MNENKQVGIHEIELDVPTTDVYRWAYENKNGLSVR